MTCDTSPPSGSFAAISTLTGRLFDPSAGLTANGGPLGVPGVPDVPGAGLPVAPGVAPGTNSAVTGSSPQPDNASDAIRPRVPTNAPARANLPIPTPVVAHLADIVPYSRRPA
ncbi:hypothetical protein Xph01_45300 [Micromonospora phaseoli]|nr:hypothetical protein Xph01_45300 [Micromonospora phaseoli]